MFLFFFLKKIVFQVKILKKGLGEYKMWHIVWVRIVKVISVPAEAI